VTLRPSMQPRETRSEALARWELQGWIERACPGCKPFYNTLQMPWDVALREPSHLPSHTCESGFKPHCTCERCGW
jgi:hypothetical protein